MIRRILCWLGFARIKCYDCEYIWRELSNTLFIECKIQRKSQMGVSSSWWIHPKFDVYGHRKYLKRCPNFKKAVIE